MTKRTTSETTVSAKKNSSAATNPRRRERKSAGQLTVQNWIDAATKVLAEKGIDAVRVEPLAAQLSVTKGSFYHHFADRPALHRAILADWRRRATKLIIDRINNKKLTSKEKLRDLFELPSHGERSKQGANLELAIRLWSKKNPDAKLVVDEVDGQRITFISDLYEELGLEEERAHARAFLFYASMMGQALFEIPSNYKDENGVIERLLRD